MRAGIRHTPPEGEGTSESASIKQAGTASGRGVGVMVEVKEGTGGYHCRGCALRVWVASSIECIKVKDEIRGVKLSMKGRGRALTKRDSGGRVAAIIKA